MQSNRDFRHIRKKNHSICSAGYTPQGFRGRVGGLTAPRLRFKGQGGCPHPFRVTNEADSHIRVYSRYSLTAVYSSWRSANAMMSIIVAMDSVSRDSWNSQVIGDEET